MSALVADTVPQTRSAPEIQPVSHPLPFPRLTRVELRKMLDTRAGFWLMASIVISALLATIAVILFAPAEDLTYLTSPPPSDSP